MFNRFKSSKNTQPTHQQPELTVSEQETLLTQLVTSLEPISGFNKHCSESFKNSLSDVFGVGESTGGPSNPPDTAAPLETCKDRKQHFKKVLFIINMLVIDDKNNKKKLMKTGKKTMEQNLSELLKKIETLDPNRKFSFDLQVKRPKNVGEFIQQLESWKEQHHVNDILFIYEPESMSQWNWKAYRVIDANKKVEKISVADNPSFVNELKKITTRNDATEPYSYLHKRDLEILLRNKALFKGYTPNLSMVDIKIIVEEAFMHGQLNPTLSEENIENFMEELDLKPMKTKNPSH